MNISKETFDKSSISRKQVVKERYNRELKESTLSARIESNNANPAKYVVEYDFQNLSKMGEPLITEHVKDILRAATADEADKLFWDMIEKGKEYDSVYVAISRPNFLNNALISTDTYRVYSGGKIIKDVKLEGCNESVKTESASYDYFQFDALNAMKDEIKFLFKYVYDLDVYVTECEYDSGYLTITINHDGIEYTVKDHIDTSRLTNENIDELAYRYSKEFAEMLYSRLEAACITENKLTESAEPANAIQRFMNASEEELKSDLTIMKNAFNEYAAEHKKLPRGFDALTVEHDATKGQFYNKYYTFAQKCTELLKSSIFNVSGYGAKDAVILGIKNRCDIVSMTFPYGWKQFAKSADSIQTEAIMSDEEYEKETEVFANKLEELIRAAFPDCKYEEILETQGKHGRDCIYVTLFGHTYEVEFNAASQEEDIREMGAEKAAKVYADDAIQNIENQLIYVANNSSSKMPDFNKDNAATFLDEIEGKIKEAVHDFMIRPEIGFDEDEADEYSSVSADIVDDYIQINVGAELSYEPLSDLCDALNPIVAAYDDNSYFEPECPGRIVAYLFG